MKIYHGTNEMACEQILDCGYITTGENSEDTQLINEILNKHNGDMRLREGCIFLTCDIDSMEIYDRAFEVEIDKLNKNLLYVGCLNLADKIHQLHYMGRESGMEKLVQEYTKSYISYEEYIKDEEEYNRIYEPEFIYFGDIEVTEGNLI